MNGVFQWSRLCSNVDQLKDEYTQTFHNREDGVITPVMSHEARHALDLTSSTLKQTSPYRVFLKNSWGPTARYKNGFTIHEFLACAEELENLFLRQDFSQLVISNQSRPYYVGERLLEFQGRLMRENLEPYEGAEASWQISATDTISIALNGLVILIGGEQVDIISGSQVISSWIDANLAVQIQSVVVEINSLYRSNSYRQDDHAVSQSLHE